MDDELAALLKSSNPDDRIAGIQQLMDEDHPDIYKILKALYKREKDILVQEVIADAVREFKAHTTASARQKTQTAKTTNLAREDSFNRLLHTLPDNVTVEKKKVPTNRMSGNNDSDVSCLWIIFAAIVFLLVLQGLPAIVILICIFSGSSCLV